MQAKPPLQRLSPIRHWFQEATPASVKADSLAGLTNATIVLPQGVAFAIIVTIVAALWGSSRVMVSGPMTAIWMKEIRIIAASDLGVMIFFSSTFAVQRVPHAPFKGAVVAIDPLRKYPQGFGRASLYDMSQINAPKQAGGQP